MRSRLKIAFLDPSNLAYDAGTPFEKPIGGTQSAACYLATALAKRGHDTTLFNSRTDTVETLGVCARTAFADDERHRYNDYDILIVLTVFNGKALREAGVNCVLVNWQHQSVSSSKAAKVEQPGERDVWDRIVYVSDQQRSGFIQAFRAAGVVIRNAPAPVFSSLARRANYFFESDQPPRFIYSSAPGRGLDHLLVSFPTIRAAVPGATLTIHSDQKIYQVKPEEDEYAVFYELARVMPGVDYVGSVPQVELAVSFQKADIWMYPTTFVETSCIAMMEAGCAGLGLLTSDLGALPETAAGFAKLLEPKGSRTGWARDFAATAIAWIAEARRDPVQARQVLDAEAAHFQGSSWDQRASEWEPMLRALEADRSTRVTRSAL